MPNNSIDEHSSYMASFSLDSISQAGALLDVQLCPNTIRQFIAIQPLDEHYFPSSLTFG